MLNEKLNSTNVSNTIGISISIVLIILLTIYIQNQTIDKSKEVIGASLDTVKETTKQSLLTWSRQQRREALSWAKSDSVTETVLGLLKDEGKTTKLRSSLHQKELRKLLTPQLAAKLYEGYFIISRNGINLASSRDSNVGNSTLINDSFLKAIWAGGTALSVPLKSDVILRDKNGIPFADQVSMFVGAPIVDNNNTIIATLTFRINPNNDFNKILERGRIGISGETYAVDENGIMVSKSRFEKDLINIGLIKSDQSSATNLSILNPKINLLKTTKKPHNDDLTLTIMADSVTRHREEHNWDGYNDYRGVKVLGSWVWIEELSLGLATEIDKDEALDGAYFNNIFSTLFTVMVIIFILGLAYIQNKSKKKLQDKETYLASIIETASEALIITNKKGIITSFNRFAEEMFGYSEQEIIGRSINILLDGVLAERHDDILNEYFKTYDNTSRVLVKIESVAIKKDGTTFPVFVSTGATVVNGEIICTGVFHDLTKLNQAKTDLIVLNEELEERVVQRTEEANMASMAKSEFLANMSHEIRTPLNAITGFNTLLFNTPLNDEQKVYVSNLGKASDNLLSLINDILDFSKIEASKLDIEEKQLNIDTLLDSLSTLLSVKTEDKCLEIIFDVADKVPHTILGDYVRLNQILVNLCSNAVKFTLKGEIKISIDCVKEEAELSYLKFAVTDTGIGIPEKSLQTLFEAFTQADASITRKFGGTGLGLTISKNLVSLMGGQLEVVSEENKGSTFSFTLPMKKSDEISHWTVAHQDLLGYKVLLVEDNKTNQAVIANTLKSNNFDVTVVSSGEEALALTQNKKFDIVLMDMMMGGIDGIETSKKIRMDKAFDASVIIMITGIKSDGIITQIQEAGIDGFLQKPITPNQLMSTINGVVNSNENGFYMPISSEVSHYLIDKIVDNNKHVLLVEDNELNQIVVNNILEKAGFEVSIANNGKEAVEMVHSNTYDLILMDVQMPIMDGYESTRHIRKDFIQIPIVAMTANALKADKEKVLESGMNDYLSKPLDPNKMFELIGKWLSISGSLASVKLEKTNYESSKPSKQKAELKYINYDTCLERFLEDEELMLETIMHYARVQAKSIDEIIHSYQEKDFKQFSFQVHALKGAAGNLSITPIFELLSLIEDNIKAENITKLDKNLALLKTLSNNVQTELESLATPPKQQKTAMGEVNKKAALATLIEIEQHLKSSKLVDSLLFENLEENMGDSWEDEGQNLVDLAHQFEFSQALSVLQNIQNQLASC